MADNYDHIHQTTWARRTAGLFSGGFVGGAYGVVVGTVAAFMPALLSALNVPGITPAGAVWPGATEVLTSIGLFSSTIALIGMGVAADVGVNSSAVATGLAKHAKDMQGDTPSLPAREEDPAEEKKKSSIYLWKAAPILIPMFAAFGALIASNPLTALKVASLSFEKGALIPGSTASIIASSVVFGTMGALMAFRSSLFTNKLSNFFMNVFNGKVFDTVVGMFTGKEPAPAPEKTLDQPKTQEPVMQPAEPCSTEEVNRFRDLLASQTKTEIAPGLWLQ